MSRTNKHTQQGKFKIFCKGYNSSNKNLFNKLKFKYFPIFIRHAYRHDWHSGEYKVDLNKRKKKILDNEFQNEINNSDEI